MASPIFSCYRLTFKPHTLSLLLLVSRNGTSVTKDMVFIHIFYPNGSSRESTVRESNNITFCPFPKSSYSALKLSPAV
jgi:hypothetical protein